MCQLTCAVVAIGCQVVARVTTAVVASDPVMAVLCAGVLFQSTLVSVCTRHSIRLQEEAFKTRTHLTARFRVHRTQSVCVVTRVATVTRVRS